MNDQKNLLRRQPQQQRSQKRVERILDAAAIVFDEVGFEAATTHAIASRADTAVGSLYQFFPDKLAIFNALELRHVERVHVIWERLLRSEVVRLPFVDFIHTITTQFQKLFEQPTSKIVFLQFFTSPTIFRNIDVGFTQEAIRFTAKLFKARNVALTEQRSLLLGEICVHGINTLILLALRSDRSHAQEIFYEIEVLLKVYLKADLGDEAINNEFQLIDKLTKSYQLTPRQSLILGYAANSLEITIQNCEAMLPEVSRRTLQRDLKVLTQHKLLLAQGDTDLRRYGFNPQITDDN
jgi:AcrR family transcriptional regulator